MFQNPDERTNEEQLDLVLRDGGLNNANVFDHCMDYVT